MQQQQQQHQRFFLWFATICLALGMVWYGGLPTLWRGGWVGGGEWQGRLEPGAAPQIPTLRMYGVLLACTWMSV